MIETSRIPDALIGVKESYLNALKLKISDLESKLAKRDEEIECLRTALKANTGWSKALERAQELKEERESEV